MLPPPAALIVLDPPPGPATALARTVERVAAAARAQGRVVIPLASGGDGLEAHERLAEAGVRRVALCGAASLAGVLAAARGARALGYEVDVLADASAEGPAGRAQRARREIEALGARRRSWAELLSEGDRAVAVPGLGEGDTTLWCGALRDCVEDGVGTYDALAREVGWAAMMHRGGEVPRRVAVQGTRGPDGAEALYRHPVDGQPPVGDWTPVVDAIRRGVEARTGSAFNHCLLQLYRDGRDWISEHSDKTLDLARPSPIVNVSLGRTRTMILRPKRGDGAPERLPLPHGSMLVMGLATNRTRYHEIRREGAAPGDGPRISLTFRHIGTWHDPATGAVWGVGAPAADRPSAEARARARAALPPGERASLERAEAERMLQLFRAENVDPDFDPAAFRPGFEVVDLRALDGGG